MARLDALYERLPVWAQHSAVSLYGLYWRRLRFGTGYQQALDGFLQRERLTQTEWQQWQSAALKELLLAALQHVPYYGRAWNESEKSAATAGQLTDLPLLEKEAVRADAYAFLRDDCARRNLQVFYTSGSSGTPIASLWTVNELRASMAVREARSARWAGVSFQHPRATFSGRMVEPDPASKGPFYRFNLAERQAYLSPFHLRPDTARQYVAALRKHKIEWLTGYAVSYYLLAKFILDEQIEVPPLKAVITTSEKVTAEMRTVMERAYGCKVYEEYSAVENVLFASECSRGRLHVSPEVGVIEILRSDGSPCAPGEIGEVVATGLLRRSQPLIRYRLGDLAAWDDAPCPCGVALPVIKEIVGRIEDVISGPDGRQLVRFHGIFVNQPHVREGQVIQEALDRIRVKVVPVNGFGTADQQEIVQRIQQRLGAQVHVIVEPVETIPRTASGKFKAVISLLNAKEQSD